MNKKFVYYFLAVVIISALPKTAQVIRTHLEPQKKLSSCAEDTKICPDNSIVTRVSPSCDFAMCPSISIASTSPLTEENVSLATTSTATEITHQEPQTISKNTEETKTVTVTKTAINEKVVTSVISVLKNIVNTVTSPFISSNNIPTGGNPHDATIPASTYITSSSSELQTSVYKALPPSDFAGQKYLVKDNNILSNDNKVIYTIPPEVISAVSSPNTGWTNTTINVIPVGTVAPILNAIPIKDLPGKYYLSENSFGNIEACEFSNKIFILDTYTNTVTLMYEENNTTLSHDDPRACNSEIFLLATEDNNLILKYHTIGTDTLCDSAWSEPDKTFFLDVTKLRTEGMKHYTIPEGLSATAEQEEEACRTKLQI